MSTCRECKLYDLDATKDVRGRVLTHRAAQCGWSSKEQWPSSVQPGFNARPKPSFMRPTDGRRCPCFQKVKQGGSGK